MKIDKLILIIISLSGCTSLKEYWKNESVPEGYDIESIETNYLGTGMDRINYKNGNWESRKLSQWELDKYIDKVDPEQEPIIELREEESDDYSLEENKGLI
jgi:hypothetical protein